MFRYLTVLLAMLLSSPAAYAAQSFSGSNLYYAAGLTSSQRQELFTSLQDAGVKVLRVWLDPASPPQKGTEIEAFGGLENDQPGQWDDTVLDRLDDVMVDAANYGIKLHISMHSYNALSGNWDFYGKWYGTGDFYTSDDAFGYFRNRLKHILEHTNQHTGKTWAESSDYIFAFEPQNEAMHDLGNPGALTSWQCKTSQVIKDNLKSDILVSTGGGMNLQNSVLDDYFTCAPLDVIGIHVYYYDEFREGRLQPYIDKAKSSGKILIMQEWGACYYDSPNQSCSQSGVLDSSARDSNIRNWAGSMNNVGLPWMYWQILPNPDPHGVDWDYEIGINDVNWDALKGAGHDAGNHECAFDLSNWLQ